MSADWRLRGRSRSDVSLKNAYAICRVESSKNIFILLSICLRATRLTDVATKETTMRFMILIKANKDSEAGVMPSQQLLAEMGKFNEELVKAGIMLGGDGLHPTSKAARVRF